MLCLGVNLFHDEFMAKLQPFNYDLDFETLNFREHPELYAIGRGEQGVLLVEPYKSEILPHWRFKSPAIARSSAEQIYRLFLDYLEAEDFVGADMARKFIQMGHTRARRYANYKGGKKYKQNPQKAQTPAEEKRRREQMNPREIDPVKAESARIFKTYWERAKTHPEYVRQKELHLARYRADTSVSS